LRTTCRDRVAHELADGGGDLLGRLPVGAALLFSAACKAWKKDTSSRISQVHQGGMDAADLGDGEVLSGSGSLVDCRMADPIPMKWGGFGQKLS